MSLFKRLSSAVAALVALLAIGIGLPIALTRWGSWPINGVPTWKQVTHLPSTIVTDSSMFGILTVATWVVWVGFLASVVVELVASINGRPGVDLPLCGPLQRLARPLVASLVMSVSAAGSLAPPSAGGLPSTRPVAAHEQPVEPVGTVPPEIPSARAPNRGPDAGQTVEVRPNDTYWEIAERLYGDGLRWRELRDANVGRQMPDGDVIQADSDLLRPGWLLVIPGRSPDTGAAETTILEITAGPGDSMWKLATTHLAATLDRPPTDDETAAYCRSLVEANRDRLADPADPDLIYSGQTFVLPPYLTAPPPPPAPPPPVAPPVPESPPADPVPVTTTPPPTTSPQPTATSPAELPSTTEQTVPAGGGTAPTEQPAPSPRETATDESEIPALLLATFASTALAVGITRAVRRRRKQRNHLAPATAPLPPADEPFHRELIAAADEDIIASLAAGLADLARRLADAEQACRPRLVQHGAGTIDVYLDRPTTPALGEWQAIADGHIWSLNPATAHVLDASSRWTTPAPLLVSLGRPDIDGQLCLDLEAAAVTTLTGHPAVARDLIRTIAAEVVHSPMGEATQVFVIGDLDADDLLNECDQITVFDGWDSVIGDIAQWADQSRSALASKGQPNPFSARATEPDDDALLPLLLLAVEPPDSPDALAFLHSSPAAAAVVVINDTPLPGSTIVHCTPGELQLPQFSLSCVPQTLDRVEAIHLAGLLRSASDPTGTQLSLSIDLDDHRGNGKAGPEPTDAPDPYHDPPYDLIVRFLGNITIEGSVRRPLVGKEVAAVAYVAMHRSVPIDRVEDALWAAPTPGDGRRQRLFHIMSACRSAIRNELLPTAQEGRYTVAEGVTTDLELFDARLAAADTDPDPESAADLLLSALGLCSGPVFRHPNRDRDSFGWIDSANLVSHWDLKITQLAQDLAGRRLNAGDTGRAIAAAEAGLRAMPTHSGCTEALMRAHAADGNREGCRGVYRSHVAALELIHLDRPAESTADLYEQLLATT